MKTRKALLYLLILVAPLSAAAMGLWSEFFAAPEFYATGEEPLDVATGDLNGDGITDVVTANRSGFSLSVFAGNGDGTLTEIQTVKLEQGATSVAIGDRDLDGLADVVASVCNYGCTKNGIQIFKGVGDGRLEIDRYIETSGVPYHITLRDLDGDGFSDIAASDAIENRIQVFLSSGEAGNIESHYLPTEKRPISLAAGDVNADGRIDLVAANQWSDSISLYLGTEGDFVFSSAQHIPSGKLPYAVTIKDLDGDTYGDIIVAHSSEPGQTLIFYGSEDAMLEQGEPIETVGRQVFVYSEDFTSDGLNDIALTYDKGSSVHVFPNLGERRFNSEAFEIPSGRQIYSLGIDFLDNDDFPDLVFVDFENNALVTALGQTPQ